jgi:hypothetical protein
MPFAVCAVPGLAAASMFWTGHSGKPGIDLSLIGTRLGTACIAALMGAAATLTLNPSHAQSLMSPCMRVCEPPAKLNRRIALAKNQRALKPSAALSFAQTQSKS